LAVQSVHGKIYGLIKLLKASFPARSVVIVSMVNTLNITSKQSFGLKS